MYTEIGNNYSLSRQLNKFPQQWHPFAQTRRQHNFGYNPVLNLIETPDKNIQIGRNLSEMMSSERLVQQLILVHRPKQIAIEQSDVVRQLFGA